MPEVVPRSPDMWTRLLLKAVSFATVKHDGQRRSGTNLPYIVHPLEVAQILLRYTSYPVAIHAAVLHDVIEDTDATYGEVCGLFGDEVANVVMEVTDDPTLTKKEQREHLFAHADKKSHLARMVKIADGISNVSGTDHLAPAGWSRSLKLSYVKTCARVGEACYRGGGIPDGLYEELLDEVRMARERLSKKNYAAALGPQ